MKTVKLFAAVVLAAMSLGMVLSVSGCRDEQEPEDSESVLQDMRSRSREGALRDSNLIYQDGAYKEQPGEVPQKRSDVMPPSFAEPVGEVESGKTPVSPEYEETGREVEDLDKPQKGEILEPTYDGED